MDLSVILICLAVSIDAFVTGFAFGLKKMVTNLYVYLGIFFVTLIFCITTMYFGKSLSLIISLDLAGVFCSIILILLGIYSLWQSKQQSLDINYDINKKQYIIYFFLILAVAIDASIAAFSVGLKGFNICVPILLGIMHVALFFIGNFIARKGKIFKFINYWYVPGFILIALGILSFF